MNPFERIQGAWGALGGQPSPQQQQMGVLPPAAQMASQAPQTGMFAKFNNHLQDNRSAMMNMAAGMMGGPGQPGSIGQGFQNYAAASPLDTQRQEKAQNKNATHDWLKKNGHSDEEIAFFQANPQVMAEALKPKTVDALKLFGQEQDLRKEYSSRDETKDFNDVLGAYKKVRAAAETNSGAGDMSLIFGYMKMVDPGSTVREGEFATAQQAGGVPDRIVGLYNQILNGKRLSPDQRQDFVRTAEGMYKTHAETMQGVQGEYGNIAGSWGVDPSRIYQPVPEFQPMQVGQEVDAGSGIKVRRTN